MNPTWLILVPVLGGLLAWLSSASSSRASERVGERSGDLWARCVSLLATAVLFVLAAILWGRMPRHVPLTGGGAWIAEVNWSWIPQLGIRFHLAVDGLSLLMVLLTAFLGFLSIVASWTGIRRSVPFFHANLLFTLAGIVGVFLAMDLFLFYFFWELMLIPMYFLINNWGRRDCHAAAVKFFIFTQLSGLFMLLAILGLYFIHGSNTGNYTFDYAALLGTAMSSPVAMWLTLGFFVAFAVKLPVVPVHTWQPDAYAAAPTAASVILAGLMSKTGAYGLLRFVVPLFPHASAAFTTVAMTLAVIGILYGAVMAFAQTDLKRLIAYSSISHLGFVLLGVFAWNQLALQGAVMQMICHALSTGGLFILAGALEERIGTLDLDRMGGLWAQAPRMGAAAMFLAMASLGLPGLGNFIAEFLVLFGTYFVSVTFTAIAAGGMIFSTVYAVWLIQRVFHGPANEDPPRRMSDLRAHETVVMAVLILTLVWLGLYPQPVLDTNASAIRGLQQDVASPAALPSASVDLPKDQTVEPRRENGDGLLTGKLNPGHLLRNQSPFSAGGAP